MFSKYIFIFLIILFIIDYVSGCKSTTVKRKTSSCYEAVSGLFMNQIIFCLEVNNEYNNCFNKYFNTESFVNEVIHDYGNFNSDDKLWGMYTNPTSLDLTYVYKGKSQYLEKPQVKNHKGGICQVWDYEWWGCI